VLAPRWLQTQIQAVRRALVVAGVAGGCCGVGAAIWLLQGRPARYGELAWSSVAEEASPSPVYRLAGVALGTTGGRRINCVLRLPAAPAAPRSLLGVLLLGGIGTGRRAATLVAPEFRGLILSCDYPFRDPSDFSGAQFALLLPAIRRDVLGTPDALRIAASYLLSRPEVDSARLAGVGASLGVPVVSAWASRDRRVAAVALVMGGADLRALFDANLGGRIRSAAVRSCVAALFAVLLGPLEPARTVGGIAPRPVLIVGAPSDERIPRRSTELLYAAARDPKELRWLGSRHMLPRDIPLLQAVTDSTLAWVTRHLVAGP
jgi:fermentation-respiration switch protein FrsA (DUF1100 family)